MKTKNPTKTSMKKMYITVEWLNRAMLQVTFSSSPFFY
jgi:hypothetical protein